MGSKNLKAITVRGQRLRFEHDEATAALLRDYVDKVRASSRYETWARFSNTTMVTWADEAGLLATHNYRRVRFEGAERIDGKRLIDHVTRPRTCHRCPVHCKAGIEIREGPYAGTKGERPDLEPIMNLGSKCGVDDPEAVLYLYNLAGDLGIDAISTAGALAFAMDLYERGIISAEDTGGVDGRHEDALETFIFGHAGHGQDAVRVAHSTIEGELTDEEARGDVGPELVVGQENPQSDGEVVGGTFLTQVGGGQVDSEARAREGQAGVLDGRADPFARFLDGGVGEADDGEGGQPAGDVHLHLDDGPFEPDDRATEDLGQHAASLGSPQGV